jgi:hypothetical protein
VALRTRVEDMHGRVAESIMGINQRHRDFAERTDSAIDGIQRGVGAGLVSVSRRADEAIRISEESRGAQEITSRAQQSTNEEVARLRHRLEDHERFFASIGLTIPDTSTMNQDGGGQEDESAGDDGQRLVVVHAGSWCEDCMAAPSGRCDKHSPRDDE